MKSLRGLLLALGSASCSSIAAPPTPPERTVVAPDGVALTYEVSGSGEPTLVFVHGWGCDRSFWRSTLQEFAPTHRVVALDLAGHGSSGAGRTVWTLAALAGDVVAVVDALAAERVILIGHSMGGPIALLSEPRLRPRVLGVIGVDTLHDVDFHYPPGFLEQAAAALESDFPRAMEASIRSALPPTSAPGLYDWILGRALRTDRKAAVSLLRGLEGFDLATVLAAVRVPVRVINAAPRTREQLATNSAGNQRYADFGAQLIENVGHFPMLERPAEFQTELHRWVDALAQN